MPWEGGTRNAEEHEVVDSRPDLVEDFGPSDVGRQVLLWAVDPVEVDAILVPLSGSGLDPVWSVPWIQEEAESPGLRVEVGLLEALMPLFVAPPGASTGSGTLGGSARYWTVIAPGVLHLVTEWPPHS